MTTRINKLAARFRRFFVSRSKANEAMIAELEATVCRLAEQIDDLQEVVGEKVSIDDVGDTVSNIIESMDLEDYVDADRVLENVDFDDLVETAVGNLDLTEYIDLDDWADNYDFGIGIDVVEAVADQLGVITEHVVGEVAKRLTLKDLTKELSAAHIRIRELEEANKKLQESAILAAVKANSVN